MKSGRGFLDIFDSLIDRILCVLGAVLFSQGPEFMQQYLQRLGGHLEEARHHLAAFQETAKQSGLSLEQLIIKTGSNPDPAVTKLGGVMSDTVDRVAWLQAAHESLQQASLWERPFVFLRHLDLGIARATGVVFQPAVPTTAEGLIYALSGMLVFLACYHVLFKRLVSRSSWRTKAPKSPAKPAA